MDLFPAKVKVTQDHRYLHEDGSELMGFSHIYDEFVGKKFEAEKVAYFVGKAQGSNMDIVLSKWDEQRAAGVKVDEAITHFLKTGEIKDESLREPVNEIVEIYKGLKLFPQVLVFNLDYRTAGTADLISLTSNRKDSKFIVSDFKCFDDVLNTDGSLKYTYEENLFVNRGWLQEPFTHLSNTKFTKICFQLGFYAYHFEILTGRKCKELFIHLIKASSCIAGKVEHKKINIPYIRTDVELLLEYNKDKIKNKLSEKLMLI